MEILMNVLEKIEKTEVIGTDFLLWLWFRSETQNGIFDLGDDLHAEILIDGKMTLENIETQDKVTCSGNNPLMKEARLALIENKKITMAAIKMVLNGEDEFTFKLDSRWMNFKMLRTPKVLLDFKEDPEGIFYEKVGLIEKAITVMDSVFMHFINLRISPEWESDVLPALSAWIGSGKNI
jgi:hypothetical protein